jgi:hypothetical protein
MPTISDLGQRVKAKYPGSYDDLPDEELGRRIQAKYPGAYDDFTAAPAAPKPAPSGPQILTEEPAVPPVEPRRVIGGVVSTTPYRDPLRQITTPAKPGEQRIGRTPDEDVIDRVGRMLTEFWYGGVGSGETLLSRATTPVPSDPNLAAVDKTRIPMGQTPLVRPEVFAGETRGPHRAILEAAGGLTTPENAVLLGGTAAARAIPGAAQAFSGGFATQMLTEALHADPEWAEAKATGDDAVMAEIATRKGVQLLFGLAAGAHAVRGKTAGVRENRTTEPAARAAETGAVSETPTFPVEQTGREMVRATPRNSVPDEMPAAETPAAPVEAKPKAQRKRPSLGGTGREIYQAWKALSEGPQPPRASIEGYVPGVGRFGWRDGKIQALEARHMGRGRGYVSTTRDATVREIQELHDAIDRGQFQVEQRTIRGALGVREHADAGALEKVLHQATGRPLPEFLETEAGKAWSNRVRALPAPAAAETPKPAAPIAPRQTMVELQAPSLAEDLSKRNVLQLKVIARKEGLDLTQFHGKGAKQKLIEAITEKRRGAAAQGAEVEPATEGPAALGLLDQLTESGRAASERLRARGVASGANVSMNEFLNPKTIRDMAQSIAGDVARGELKMETLAGRLSKEYGTKARWAAQRVWNEAQNILKPLGADEFSEHGPVFRSFWRDEAGATKRLKELQAGDAQGALYHPRVGLIDMIWGWEGTPAKHHSDGYGLAHILAKHPNVEGRIQQIINESEVTQRTGNRIVLGDPDYGATIKLDFLKREKRWLLSAYDERPPAAEGGLTPRIPREGATGTTPPVPEGRPPATEGSVSVSDAPSGAAGTASPAPGEPPPLIARREAAVKRFDSLVEHGSQLVEEGQPFSAWKRAMQREFPDASSGELMRAWPRAKKRHGERGSISAKPAITPPSAEEVAGAKSRLKSRAKEFLESEKGEQSFELSTQDFQDLLTVGRDLVSRNVHRAEEWKTQMVDTFGEWVREHLDRIWDEVQKFKRAASLSAYSRKGGNESGFLVRRTGGVIDLSENARHYNMVRDLEGELRRGAIRGRGNGIEYRGEVDPANLRAAVKRVADRYPEVYVDSPRGSLIYDSADLVRHRYSVALTKPARRVGHEAERGSLSLRPAKPVSVVEQGAEYAAKPSAFWAAIDFLRPVESRIASEGQAGKKLSSLLAKAQDAGEVAAGKRIVKLWDSGLFELDKAGLENLHDALEGRADPANAAIRKAFDAVREISDEIALEAETAKVQVKEKRTAIPGEELPAEAKLTGRQKDLLAMGRKVPYTLVRLFRRRVDFFPHIIPSTEALKSGAIRKDVIDNLVRQGIRPDAESAAKFVDAYREFIDKGGRSAILEKYLVESGQALGRSEAFWLLNRFRKRHIRRQGSLEYSRQVDLPFYDPNPVRVLAPWVHSTSMRMAQIREFGQGNDLVNHLVREIDKAGGNAPKARMMVDRVLRMIEEPDTDGAKLSRTLRALQGFKLGLSAIPNVAQGALNSLLASDLPSTLAGAKGLLTKKGRRFAMESGASLEGVINEMVQYAGGGDTGLNQALSKFLKGVAFTATEQANRIFAANAGITYARRMLSRLKANPENGRARKVLEELGLDADALLKKGAIEGNDALQAAKKFSDLTQFRADPKDLPLFASSNAGKVFFQFKQYIYGQTRLLHREVVEEFAAGRFGRGARALVVLGIVFPMAGEVIQDLRSLITGRKRPTKALERYFDDLGAVGSLGVLQDLFTSAKYGRAGEWAVGPTGGEVIETIENATRDVQSGKPLSEPRKSALLKQAFRRIPLLGPMMVNRIFGKPEKRPSVREPARRKTGTRRRVIY